MGGGESEKVVESRFHPYSHTEYYYKNSIHASVVIYRTKTLPCH